MEAAVDLGRAKARVKVLAASSPGEYIILNQNTGEKISIKCETKRIVFQIGYEEKGLNARAELLRRFGHEVISVTHILGRKREHATCPPDGSTPCSADIYSILDRSDSSPNRKPISGFLSPSRVTFTRQHERSQF